ncbi:MAG TPA: YCF48-related protein [Blastocatellia bacterium]|nr:YCF48-related protein [Blastocatellia bacterium]HNG31476.1 YCF48-related protein [Blastocatellia bacterium]
MSISSQAQSRGFAIQISSATTEAEAQATISELKSKGVEAYLVKSEVVGKGMRYRVRVGKFPTLQQAKVAGDHLVSEKTILEFAVMVYDPPATATAQRESKKKTVVAAEAESPRPRKEEPAAPEKAEAGVVKSPEETKASVVEETVQPAVTASPIPAKPEPRPEPATEMKPAPTAPTSPVAEIKPAENKPAEIKPEPTPEAPPVVEIKPESKPEIPAATSPAEMTASVEPKIATPPIADALTEAAFNKSNWKLVRRNAETDKNLRAVHFVDTMTGWAAGDAGAVYRTTDGGRTWKPLLSGVSANINFIHFLDWNHGWMIGEAIKGIGSRDEDEGETLLLNTINGGRTWMIQKIPNLLSVYFTDLQNGWAVGKNATLLRTTNGGTDWKPVTEIQSVIGLPVESSNYNFGFRDVFFLDANHGWLIGNFYGRAQSNIGGLFATEDGGATWKRVPVTLQTQKVSGRFTPGLLHSVQFTDASHGSVTGEMTDGEGRYFFALHTRDGGQTWEQFRTPSRATHSTQFLDPANGWMAAFAPREGSAEAVVYDTSLMRTDNGGLSWQNDFTAKGSRIRSVFFLSPNKGWAVGDRGIILRYEEKSKAMN